MSAIAGALCSAVGIVLYLNTLNCGFCYDDKVAVLQNQDLLPTSPWANLLWNDFWGNPMQLNTSHKSYRPLCVASFRLNYMLHGLQPMGYHLVNVLLHAMVCYLYVQLCALVFTQVWPALLAGLLFAVHPIHTEAVSDMQYDHGNWMKFHTPSLSVTGRRSGWESRSSVRSVLPPIANTIPLSCYEPA